MSDFSGRIVKALSGFYYVEKDNRIIECRARGIFRKRGAPPLVGDIAAVTMSGDSGVIDAVHERKSAFVRPPLANIDRLYIVSSFSSPEPNAFIIDKLTVTAERASVEPVIVFNKCDTGNFDRWKSIYEHAGFRVFVVSAASGEGIEGLKADISGCFCAFTGNSGVGKSSLINAIAPELGLQTGQLSDKLGRGRHTTRHTQMYPVGSGYIADTPGFATVECEHIDKHQLVQYFRDIAEHGDRCRFTGCSHTAEAGCAVRSAVDNGQIEPTRYMSYCRLYDECASVSEWDWNKRK